VPLKERGELVQHCLLLGRMAIVLGESRHRRQDFGDGGAGGRDAAIAESIVDEGARGFGVEVFFRDDAFQLLGLLRSQHEGLPLRVHLGLGSHRIHELLDQVLLVAQAGAGIDGALDGGADFLVVARAFLLQVLLDQQQDVIDVDFDLLDEFDLEHHVVVDRLLLGLRRAAEFGVQVQVQALVILKLALAEDFVACRNRRRPSGCSSAAGSSRTA
jgi:hypothetical protein